MERHDEARSAHRALLRADGRYADLQAPEGEPVATCFIGHFDSAPCPVCKEDGGPVVWVGNISRQVRTWGHLDPIRQWVQCDTCETIRVDAPPSPAALNRWTLETAGQAQSDGTPDIQSFNEALVGWQTELDTIQRLGFGVAWLNDPETPEPRVLEIGSEWGSFIAAAQWRGFNPIGVTTADQAAWATASLNLPCIAEDLSTGLRPEQLPAGEFDIIVLRHPIDRAEDPVQVLGAAARRLAPDGVLVLQMALHDHPVRRLQGYDDPQWSIPDRRVFFSRDTLEVALARVDLRTDQIMEAGNAAPGTSLVFVRHDDMHDLMAAE